MMMVWPSVRDICSPIRRATVSVPPPAAKGTTNVTVFPLDCASAGIANRDIKRAKPVRALPKSRWTMMASLQVIHLLSCIDADVRSLARQSRAKQGGTALASDTGRSKARHQGGRPGYLARPLHALALLTRRNAARADLPLPSCWVGPAVGTSLALTRRNQCAGSGESQGAGLS